MWRDSLRLETPPPPQGSKMWRALGPPPPRHKSQLKSLCSVLLGFTLLAATLALVLSWLLATGILDPGTPSRVSASRGLDLSRLTVAELTTKPGITRGTTPQPEPESQPEPKTEPEPEPTSEPEPEIEPTSEPEIEPTSEPEIEPTSEPETEPTSEPEPEQGPENNGDADVVSVTVSSPLLAALAPRLPKPLEGEDRVEVLEVSGDILEKETLNVISSVQRLVEEVRKEEGDTENDAPGIGTTVPTVFEGEIEEDIGGEEVELEDELEQVLDIEEVEELEDELEKVLDNQEAESTTEEVKNTTDGAETSTGGTESSTEDPKDASEEPQDATEKDLGVSLDPEVWTLGPDWNATLTTPSPEEQEQEINDNPGDEIGETTEKVTVKEEDSASASTTEITAAADEGTTEGDVTVEDTVTTENTFEEVVVTTEADTVELVTEVVEDEGEEEDEDLEENITETRQEVPRSLS